MDKRWILIFIIIIIAICCGYFVVTHSDSVGKAIVDINKSTAVLPPGFSVGETESDNIELYQKNAPGKIYIQDLGKKDCGLEELEKRNKSLSKEEDIKIIDINKTVKDDTELYMLYYQNTSDNESIYYSVSYLYTSYNHTFYIKCSGFDDISKIDENLNFLAETIKPDYKKSQE